MAKDARVISVKVPLSERSYSIHIGQQLFSALPEWLPEACGRCEHALIVVDQNIAGSFGKQVENVLAADGYRTSFLEVPAGEGSKRVEEAARLWQAFLEEKADRKSCVIAVGGGVVGDLAGFVAATFARGLSLVQVPTTLLSQVDSSVGGKTGINLPSAKNMVGAFWQPSLVIIDTDTLRSLPDREFRSGLAEVVKYGVILYPDLFDYLEANVEQILHRDPGAITHIIARSCEAKAEVVAQDERETTGLRAILNYGHTFAHALESDSQYGTYLHGEAVSIGMHMAARLAARLGRVDEKFVERQQQLLQRFHLPVSCSGHDPEALWQLMQHDKKVELGTLRFILPDRLGHVEAVSGVQHAQVIEVLRDHS